MGKPYELLEVLPDGTERRLYENGDIRNQNGQVIELGGNSLVPMITPENYREYHRMRKEKILRAVENGIMKVTDAPNEAEAVAAIVAKRAKIAMTDDGRAGNDAAKIVLAAMDALPERRQETTITERHVHEIDPDTMRIVEAMVRQRRDAIEIPAENIQEIE